MRRLKDAQRLGLVCRFSTDPWNETQGASFSLGRSEERGTVIADRSVVGGARIKCAWNPLLLHPAVPGRGIALPTWNDGNCPPSRPDSGSLLSSFAGWSRTTSCQIPFWNKRTEYSPMLRPEISRPRRAGTATGLGVKSSAPARPHRQSSVGGWPPHSWPIARRKVAMRQVRYLPEGFPCSFYFPYLVVITIMTRLPRQ